MRELPTITTLQQALATNQTTSEELVQTALNRIADPAGEGARAFTKVHTEQALQAARASDALRAAGYVRSALEGLPITVKDLFDIAGDITTAGSIVLKDEPPAQKHAVAVQRLVAAGGIIVGRTNMTEFAFSGLGVNPHYGTPRSPWDRQTGRIAGGSSSGAGVAVSDAMAVVSLGTDTGGSIRIPAAFCGVTGFKPTARRIPADGTVPLSFSLDSSGPLAPSVSCCAIADALLADVPLSASPVPQAHHLRLALPDTLVLEEADEHVRTVFEAKLNALREAGVTIDAINFPEFEQLAYINRKGGLIAAEAWDWHHELIEQRPEQYDPRVRTRILRGKDMSAADYIDVVRRRAAWVRSVEAKLAYYDALIMPTTPIVPPAVSILEAPGDDYYRINGLILRNPTLINFLDGCALSIPCHPKGSAPVGFMVAGPAMHDAKVLAIGQALEPLLRA